MEATKNKGGRLNHTGQMQRLNLYIIEHAKGKNQKEISVILGITEKTAGRYERMRLKKLQPSADLIALLEAKAKDKTTTAKDLVILTKEIDRLLEKHPQTRNLF